MREAPAAEPAPPSADSHRITRRAIVGWVLYDLANTAYSMGVVTVLFPLWIRAAVGTERDTTVSQTITAVSMAIIFVLSPLLGAMADRARKRMPFLAVSTFLSVTLTMLMGHGPFMVTVVLFVLGNAAYQAGLQFYDSLLPEVSTPANRGRIGGIGIGVGYVGSYVAVGLSLRTDSKPLLFLLYGLTFLLFSLPCLFFVRERGNPNPRPINLTAMKDSLRETIHTLRSSREYPGLLRFLIGRVFYTDAINTVISAMFLYTTHVAVQSGASEAKGQETAKFIMMSSITFAIIGGFVWGKLTDRFGPKRTLNHVLRAWLLIFLFAALIGILRLPLWTMYVVAASAGFALGGVWASDRPYMLRLTPPHRIGEFYGLYGMVGRFSAVTGPIVWAVVTATLINRGVPPLTAQGIAIIILLLMVVISYVILQPVPEKPEQTLTDQPVTAA